MAVATQTFADRLAAKVEQERSRLVVGLDPRVDLLPVELRGDVARFCCGLVDAVGPHAVAVKPQLAFFEVLGPAGMAAFDEVCLYARRAGLIVIADASAATSARRRARPEAYLEATCLARRAHGRPVPRTRVGRADLAARAAAARAVRARQDVEHGADIQDVDASRTGIRSGTTSRSRSRSGRQHPRRDRAVVRRRRRRRDPPAAVAEARRLMPQAVLLLPGIGAQGGTVSVLGRAFQSGPTSALVTASRSVDCAFRETGSDYREAAGAEAARLERRSGPPWAGERL